MPIQDFQAIKDLSGNLIEITKYDKRWSQCGFLEVLLYQLKSHVFPKPVVFLLYLFKSVTAIGNIRCLLEMDFINVLLCFTLTLK